MVPNKISNMSDLRDNLCEALVELRERKIEGKDAKEIANIAGKVISSVNVELKGAALNKVSHKIKFLT